jgi:N-acetylglucosaminyldiphosphoundecaprenol N-acetyl-beta-D-mannosaminyltransferase
MNATELSQLVNRMTVVHSAVAEIQVIDRLSKVDRPTVLSFVNANTINLARRNPGLLGNLLTSSVLLRDGIGVSILFRLLGLAPGWNTNGTDFIPKVLERFTDRRAALLGTVEPYVTIAAAHVSRCGCAVSLASDGFYDPQHYVREVRTARPDLVILGMGTPKQEDVAARLAQELDFPVLIVNGGAVLDRWAGRWRRAPFLLRRIGAEWVYRLVHEPRRLTRRYLIGNITFLGWAVWTRVSAGRVAKLSARTGPAASMCSTSAQPVRSSRSGIKNEI